MLLRTKFIALSLGATCAAVGAALSLTGVLPGLLSDLMSDKTAPQQIDRAASPPAKLAAIPPAPLPQPRTIVPQFDTVRVEPSGDTVVAGHGEPNAKVTLLAGQKILGEANADDGGDFVIVPQRLLPGNYSLMLGSTTAGAKPVLSRQSITVSVPAKGQTGVVVALVQPGKPSQLLIDPTAQKPAQQQASNNASNQTKPVVSAQVSANPSSQQFAQTKPRVAIKTAEVDKGGFYAAGFAPAGTHVRIYLNGSALTDVTAGTDGSWSLTIGKGVTAGHYVVRADAIDDKGKVTARAEVPFDVPAAVAQAAVPPKPAKLASNAVPTPDQDANDNANPAPDASHAVVWKIDTATVTRGDSLWRISQKELGEGVRYTLIYQANASQIRDPNLIYPGQVFVMPHTN
jgi:nucleoid-associated protein YgaU